MGEGRKKRKRKRKLLTESVLDEVVEGVAIAVVGELVVAGRELLQTLSRDGGEVAGELGVLGQHNRAPRHERVDQLLLPHRLGSARLGSAAPSPPRIRPRSSAAAGGELAEVVGMWGSG
jgi:hypothetical protein